MDPNKNTGRAPARKMRFVPKPLKREQMPVEPKVEHVEEEIDAAQAEQLMRRFRELSSANQPKIKKEVKPAQAAALGVGVGAQSSSIRSYSTPAPGPDSSFPAEEKVAKEYKEPWDYTSSYPVTLPWRKPHSGNPELLNNEEFREDSEIPSAYDEKAINPAEELDLQDVNPENDLLFLQLPNVLPRTKQSAGSTTTQDGNKKQQQESPFEGLEAGYMGKMLIYKSGAIKLKIGDILYDVSPGVKCSFAQTAFAVNAERGQCTNLGEITKRAVVTPDLDSLLASASLPD